MATEAAGRLYRITTKLESAELALKEVSDLPSGGTAPDADLPWAGARDPACNVNSAVSKTLHAFAAQPAVCAHGGSDGARLRATGRSRPPHCSRTGRGVARRAAAVWRAALELPPERRLAWRCARLTTRVTRGSPSHGQKRCGRGNTLVPRARGRPPRLREARGERASTLNCGPKATKLWSRVRNPGTLSYRAPILSSVSLVEHGGCPARLRQTLLVLGKPFAWCFTRQDLERRLRDPQLQPESTLSAAA